MIDVNTDWTEFCSTPSASGAASEELAGACVRAEAPQRSLAAASCTRCRQCSVDCELQANKLLQSSKRDSISSRISVYSAS